MISRSKSDVTAMKDMLCVQQQLLEKLYAELDEEREASATATSEALDMILRLQGEIALVKMEASHYKRVAEEKIGHAEVSLEAFEEIMYQKEVQIASLEFQVHSLNTTKKFRLSVIRNVNPLPFAQMLASSSFHKDKEKVL